MKIEFHLMILRTDTCMLLLLVSSKVHKAIFSIGYYFALTIL